MQTNAENQSLREPRQCVDCSELIEVTSNCFSKDSAVDAAHLTQVVNRSLNLNLSESIVQLVIKKCLSSLHPFYVIEADHFNDLYCLFTDSMLTRTNMMDSLDWWLIDFNFHNSGLWPHIDSIDIVNNLKLNLSNPDTINQGVKTNLCAYSAMVRYLVEYNPRDYVALIVSLYTEGIGVYDKKRLTVEPEVRLNAGKLKYEGISNNLADQMVLLVLAQNYQKSFINIFPGKYKLGDECKAGWAGTAIQQFDRMFRTLGYNTKTKGADLFPGKNYMDSMSSQLARGEDLFVLVNGGLLKRRNWYSNFTANHFIQMRAILPEKETSDKKERYSIVIWDYGQWKIYSGITRRNFNAFTYAYTRVFRQ
jgi:hypothetical protein